MSAVFLCGTHLVKKKTYIKHQLKTIQKIGVKTLIYGFCADFLSIVLLVFSIICDFAAVNSHNSIAFFSIILDKTK